MLTDTSGNAFIYAGKVDEDHKIAASYGAKYYALTVTISSVAEQDYSQMAGTYYVHIDNNNDRVRLSNTLTSSTYVGADVSGLYATFTVSFGTLTGGSYTLYVAVTNAEDDDDDEAAFTGLEDDWTITIDQTIGSAALS